MVIGMKGKRNVSLENSDNNKVSTGDIENYYDIHPNMMLNKTRLYEFCKHFSELDEYDEPEYNTDLPSDITDKINYNQLNEFKEVFESVTHTLEDTENILSNIPRRNSIVRRIKGIYIQHKIENANATKDKLCMLVFNDLLKTIHNSEGSDNLFLEDTYFAIQALMYYAFTKCQILERVPS